MLNLIITIDKTIDELKGNIKKCYLETYNITDIETKFGFATSSLYNEKGIKKNEKTLDEYGNVRIIHESIFNGEIKKGFQSFDENYEENGGELYLFNSKNEKTELYKNGVQTYKFKYYDDGKLKTIYNLKTGVEITYIYEGKYVSHKLQSPSLIENPWNEIFKIKNIFYLFLYVNDENGNVLEMTTFDYENKTVEGHLENSYNEYGDKIETKTFDEKKNILSHYRYSYIYDNKNNWTSKEEYKDKELVKMTARKLEYYN